MTAVHDFFGPIIGRPCWLVTKVHGSIVTMKFGQPTLTVGQPHVRSVSIDGVPDMAQRLVRVEGDWLLTINLCHWSLLATDVELAHCESDDTTMARALAVLNGQQLTQVLIEPSDGSTTFAFDLGCVLSCRPAGPGVYRQAPNVMWWVSDRDSSVSVRDDGSYSAHPSDTRPETYMWRPLSTPTG